ncbi:GNAT family N-acetyltransferase, partial [Haloferax volcanii]
GVKPFYESLGFDIEERSDDEGRFRGVLRDE